MVSKNSLCYFFKRLANQGDMILGRETGISQLVFEAQALCLSVIGTLSI